MNHHPIESLAEERIDIAAASLLQDDGEHVTCVRYCLFFNGRIIGEGIQFFCFPRTSIHSKQAKPWRRHSTYRRCRRSHWNIN